MQSAAQEEVKRRDQFLAQLRASFPSLTPQFQAAARYVLDHPEEMSITSMRTIASHAGVRPATLVRLAQSLGFEGWQEIRELFVAAVRRGPQPYANRAKKVVRTGNAGRILTDMVDAQQRNLAHLRAQSDQSTDALTRAVDLLGAAQTVHIAGFRACFPIAFSFHYLYRLFRSSVQLIRGDAGALEMELRALGPKDVLFAVSFEPYSQEIIRVVNTASEAGCRVIALTDSSVSPIALQADCVLPFSNESPSFFPSISAGVAAVEVLVAQLLAKQGKGAIKALEAAETQLQRTGAYAPPRA